MEDRQKVIDIDEEKVVLSFSTDPNPTVMDAVRKMLLNHYEEINKD